MLDVDVVGVVVGPLLVLNTTLLSRCRSFRLLVPFISSSSCPCCSYLPDSRCCRWVNLAFRLPHLVGEGAVVVEVGVGAPPLSLRLDQVPLLRSSKIFET